ncbi:MAG: cobalamin-binding protein [Elusimicrobia bacterium]|nr:cobalamin-binding protein [Elusimicrobiota bacterium]
MTVQTVASVHALKARELDRAPRIVSFLPAATEMIYLLGLGDRLVGRSHECDYPAQALEKPVLVDCAVDMSRMSMGEIDAAVSARIALGLSLYAVDEEKLRAAAPDLLITQNLCQVCGPAGNEVSQVLKTMSAPPKILWQTPRTFEEVLDAVRELGRETGTAEKADEWARSALTRVREISAATRGLPRVRVAFLEWVDPVYCGGHWIPRMLEWAGGADRNSKDGADSLRIPWEAVLESRPEVIVVSPCGFKTAKALEQAEQLRRRPGWGDLPAVKAGRVYAVDANSYFARPGPRVVEGVELLAHLLHPEAIAWTGPEDAYRRLE